MDSSDVQGACTMTIWEVCTGGNLSACGYVRTYCKRRYGMGGSFSGDGEVRLTYYTQGINHGLTG